MPNNPPASHPVTAGATFNYRGSSYRLDAFLCEYTSTPPKEPFLARLMAEFEAEENAKLLPGTRRIRLRFCLPSEATYVSGSGVSGCVAAISEIEITGMVSWSESALADHQAEAQFLGEKSEFVTTIIRPSETTDGE